jgi:hypothetical protein
MAGRFLTFPWHHGSTWWDKTSKVSVRGIVFLYCLHPEIVQW